MRSSRRPRHPFVRALALAPLLLVSFLMPLPAQAANVDSNVAPDSSGYGTLSGNVYFAYVEAGEWIHAWGNGGTGTVTAPDGTAYSGGVGGANFSTPREVTAEQAGVWTFQFGGASRWAVTAYTGDPGFGSGVNPIGQSLPGGVAEVTGRVWTEQYRIDQSGGSGSLKTLNFWMLNDSGYQYALTLSDYNGVNSIVEANSMGVPAGTSGGLECTPSYRSWDVTGDPNDAPDMSCADPYRLFFEEPADDLPVSAPVAPTTANDFRTTQVISPAPVDPASLTATGFAFAPSSAASAAGTFTYDLGDNFYGGHLLQIDVDGNGSFADAVDREIRVGASGEPVSYAFDGLDGNGDVIGACTDMTARVFFDRVGEVHVVQTDVEARSIEIVRQNGPDSPNATIYWDDTQTSTARSNTINPPSTADGTAGVDSTGGVHGWNYSTSSWGNEKYIDDWTFVPADQVGGELQMPGRCLQVQKTSSADDNDGAARVGDTVEYTVTATNVGTLDFTDVDPAHVVDDLTAVLDDATYGADAAATVGGVSTGTVNYVEPRLQWSGPLAAGDSVELTYSVTVTGEGDRTGSNIAFGIPDGGDPADYTTPLCATSGFDPVTGLYCDSTVFQMPQLLIEKQADRTSVPAVGQTVTYTVTATNAGAGAFTPDAPALVVDDLSGVLDDADLDVTSVSANLGDDPAVDGDRIVWTGALAPTQSVVITYEVTYTAEGDASLDNVAFAPQDGDDPTPVCDPRTADGLDPTTGVACDISRLPGADLEVVKSADVPSGVAVAPGDVIAYTLTFTNNGAADATVDHTDVIGGLLDDATVSTPTSDTLAVGAIAGGAFDVTGVVPAGQSVTVEYTATVLPFGDQGDHVLVNHLVPPGQTPPTECVPGSELCTTHFVPMLQIAKSSDPASGTEVQSGDRLTYTLTFTNVGAGVALVDHVDDLSGVVDDADLLGEPDVVDLLADVIDERLEITGAVVSGTPQTVTYSVQVRPDGQHGDNVLMNVVHAGGETPPPACWPDVVCTQHPVGELEVTKSVDPANGSAVKPGDRLAYTLTFTNVGTAAYDVAKVDDLSGVLDDADLVTAPASVEGLLSVTGPTTEARLEITGALTAGQVDRVTYAVQVKPVGSGDGAVTNWVLDPGVPTPQWVCVPSVAVPCTSNRVVAAETAAALPQTGAAASEWLALAALLAMTAGGTILIRRRSA